MISMEQTPIHGSFVSRCIWFIAWWVEDHRKHACFFCVGTSCLLEFLLLPVHERKKALVFFVAGRIEYGWGLPREGSPARRSVEVTRAPEKKPADGRSVRWGFGGRRAGERGSEGGSGME